MLRIDSRVLTAMKVKTLIFFVGFVFKKIYGCGDFYVISTCSSNDVIRYHYLSCIQANAFLCHHYTNNVSWSVREELEAMPSPHP